MVTFICICLLTQLLVRKTRPLTSGSKLFWVEGVLGEQQLEVGQKPPKRPYNNISSYRELLR